MKSLLWMLIICSLFGAVCLEMKRNRKKYIPIKNFGYFDEICQ